MEVLKSENQSEAGVFTRRSTVSPLMRMARRACVLGEEQPCSATGQFLCQLSKNDSLDSLTFLFSECWSDSFGISLIGRPWPGNGENSSFWLGGRQALLVALLSPYLQCTTIALSLVPTAERKTVTSNS